MNVRFDHVYHDSSICNTFPNRLRLFFTILSIAVSPNDILFVIHWFRLYTFFELLYFYASGLLLSKYSVFFFPLRPSFTVEGLVQTVTINIILILKVIVVIIIIIIWNCSGFIKQLFLIFSVLAKITKKFQLRGIRP